MTDRFVSWTDAEHVAALLVRVAPGRVGPDARSSVYRSSPRPLPKAGAPGAGGAPSSSSGAARPEARGGQADPAARERAVPHRTARLVHASDNVVDRIDALVAWALANHRCAGVFVADDNGLTLAAHGVSEAIVSLVGPLLSALAAVRTIPGVEASAGALWLGAQMMSWVEARTERGGFCLGVLSDEALSAAALSGLREALDTTVRGI